MLLSDNRGLSNEVLAQRLAAISAGAQRVVDPVDVFRKALMAFGWPEKGYAIVEDRVELLLKEKALNAYLDRLERRGEPRRPDNFRQFVESGESSLGG